MKPVGYASLTHPAFWLSIALNLGAFHKYNAITLPILRSTVSSLGRLPFAAVMAIVCGVTAALMDFLIFFTVRAKYR